MKPIIIILNILFVFQVYVGYAIYYKLSDFQTGGRIVSLDINGDYVYTAKYDGLMEIINISNPEQPQLTGSIQLTDVVPGVDGRIIISDSLAFVLGQSKVHIIDVSNPFAPTNAGNLDCGWSTDIVVSENLAYVAGHNSFYIIDITNLESPQILSSINGDLDGICKLDTLIYGVHSGLLKIFNIADPQNPEVVYSGLNLQIGSNADIGISDFHVFINGGRHLWSIDIIDPTNPVITDTLLLVEHSNKIFIQNSRAIINNNSSGIKVIDISDPTNLSSLGFYDTPGFSEQVVAKENIAYVADSYSGLQILDITDNTNPNLVGSFQSSNLARGIGISDEFVYLADRTVGLDVINISDVYNPQLSGSYFSGIGSADNVSISNSNLCFSRGYPYPELLFIDISNPEEPMLLHQTDLANLMLFGSVAIFQANSHVFVGAGSTFLIYDVADFGSPNMLCQLELNEPIKDIEVQGDYCYISVGDNRIEIYNLDNISQPQIVNSFITSGSAEQMVYKSGFLIIADGNAGFLPVDVSNPAILVLSEPIMPNINSNITAKPLIINNKMIIIDQEWNEIFTYNISDFNNIQLQSSIQVNNEIHKVIYHSNLFYCSVNYYGMIILDDSSILSVDENKNSKDAEYDLSIYPNPTTNCISISSTLSIKEFTLYSISNQKTLSIKSPGNTIDISNLPPGLYFAEIKTGERNEVKKIVVK